MDAQHGMILLDVVDQDTASFDRSFLERLGHRVAVCHGPEHGTLCPILSGAGCADVDGAHGIVFALDLDRPQHRAILKQYRKVARPDLPIRAVVRPGQDVRYAELLADVQVWVDEPSVADLDGFAAQVDAIDRS